MGKKHVFRALAFASACLVICVARTNAQTHIATDAHIRDFAIKPIASTVPANGDVNPYGVAVVPASAGSLVAGDILVSNFNDVYNLQGKGSTIVQITPGGHVSTFAQIDRAALPGSCPGGIGLTTALAVTRTGWVFVGSLPTENGQAPTARSGCILVLDDLGQVVETFYGSLINGPWDLTAADGGSHVALFVTNVLNGTVAANGQVVSGGTVVRIDLDIAAGFEPGIESMTVVGSGFDERTDPSALVIGPTGVALSPDDQTLYVADSLNNRIASISDPLFRTTSDGVGDTLTSGAPLNDPLGIATAPNGDVLSVNGDDGYLVRTNPHGVQTSLGLLDSVGSPPGSGALFGLAIVPNHGIYYVDDNSNSLNLFY